MNPPLESLRSLYKRDPAVRAVVDALDDLGTEGETEVEALESEVDPEIISRNDIVGALKALEKRTCGKFIVGRKGARSRMQWRVDPGQLRAAALGEIDELPLLDALEVIEVADSQARAVRTTPSAGPPSTDADLLSHAFNLRPGLTVHFDLPSSLTRSEAERLAKFIESLPFE